MTESVSLNRVSQQMLSEIKSAFRSYAQNQNAAVSNDDSDETKTYTNRGQITRKAYYDIQNAFPRNTETEENEKEPEDSIREDTINTTIQADNTTAQQIAVRSEKPTYTLPKNTDSIISELKRNGMHKTMSAYQSADKYGISYMKAREILDKVNQDSNGFVREYKLPENSTISYKV